MTKLTPAEQDALDAKTFRRLLKHLDDNKDVQNIDLMITGNFCRNCLSKWYLTACLLYTSPSPRDGLLSRMPSSA